MFFNHTFNNTLLYEPYTIKRSTLPAISMPDAKKTERQFIVRSFDKCSLRE